MTTFAIVPLQFSRILFWRKTHTLFSSSQSRQWWKKYKRLDAILRISTGQRQWSPGQAVEASVCEQVALGEREALQS